MQSPLTLNPALKQQAVSLLILKSSFLLNQIYFAALFLIFQCFLAHLFLCFPYLTHRDRNRDISVILPFSSWFGFFFLRDYLNLIFPWSFHSFMVIFKKRLIVSYISQLLTMAIMSQLMKDSWSPVCQEIFDFSICIRPYSYITLNYVSNLLKSKYLSERHSLVVLFFFSPLITEEGKSHI